MKKEKRYIDADELYEWLDDKFPAGQDGTVDFVCAEITEKLMTMSYITKDGKTHLGIEDEFDEREERPEKPNPFENFLQDEMIEEEWNG